MDEISKILKKKLSTFDDNLKFEDKLKKLYFKITGFEAKSISINKETIYITLSTPAQILTANDYKQNLQKAFKKEFGLTKIVFKNL